MKFVILLSSVGDCDGSKEVCEILNNEPVCKNSLFVRGPIRTENVLRTELACSLMA